MSDKPTNAPSKPILLDCCCCGGGVYGRQWHNRDGGYGICNVCADEAKARGEDMKSYYGIEGFHYKVAL